MVFILNANDIAQDAIDIGDGKTQKHKDFMNSEMGQALVNEGYNQDELLNNIDNDNELVDVEVVMYGEFTVRQFINPPQPEEPRPLETFANPISWIVAATLENKYTDTDFWDGSRRKFSRTDIYKWKSG